MARGLGSEIAEGFAEPGVADALREDSDFEIYSNDILVSAFAQVAATIRVGAFVLSVIAS